MTVLDLLACSLGRRDEVPNQELAHRLAAARDTDGIREIAGGLWHTDKSIQADCVKVLYEVGYLSPDLVAPYALDFLKLLKSRNNRLVWGGMIALSTVAGLQADELYPHAAEMRRAIEHGSVITVDAGVLALAKIAAARPEYGRALFPDLLENHLRTCRPKDVPANAERLLVAVTAENREAFIAAVEARLDNASPSQATRLRRALQKARKVT